MVQRQERLCGDGLCRWDRVDLSDVLSRRKVWLLYISACEAMTGEKEDSSEKGVMKSFRKISHCILCASRLSSCSSAQQLATAYSGYEHMWIWAYWPVRRHIVSIDAYAKS